MTPLTSHAITARHGFFTRDGGVSQGPYASLNGSLSGGDDRAHVAENRARIAAHLGAAHIVGLHQVHGPDVITVTEPWAAGDGPRADAMVTRIPGIALAIITADCTPVLLHDAASGVIGAVHAGWRGALAGVLEATIEAMLALGATGGTIAASIGPCIRQPSYEVGPDLRDAVLTRDPAAARFFQPGRDDRHLFDLAAYCAARLAGLGATRLAGLGAPRLAGLGALDIVDADTLPDPRFWSHRRRTLAGGHPIGHQVSAIVL